MEKVKNMIGNVIFDLGGVLLSVDWEKRFQQCHLTGEKKEQVGRATIFNPDWLLLDKGPPEDMIAEKMIRKEPEAEPEIRRFLESFSGVIRKRDYVETWIRNLKNAGLNVYVLSNFCQKAAKDNREELGFLTEMDGVVFSYETGMIKPEREIYWHLLNEYQLKPEECVFIDDRVDNIEAGEREGIRGILFTSQGQASAELEKLLQIKLEKIDTVDSRKETETGESTL